MIKIWSFLALEPDLHLAPKLWRLKNRTSREGGGASFPPTFLLQTLPNIIGSRSISFPLSPPCPSRPRRQSPKSTRAVPTPTHSLLGPGPRKVKSPLPQNHFLDKFLVCLICRFGFFFFFGLVCACVLCVVVVRDRKLFSYFQEGVFLSSRYSFCPGAIAKGERRGLNPSPSFLLFQEKLVEFSTKKKKKNQRCQIVFY